MSCHQTLRFRSLLCRNIDLKVLGLFAYWSGHVPESATVKFPPLLNRYTLVDKTHSTSQKVQFIHERVYEIDKCVTSQNYELGKVDSD